MINKIMTIVKTVSLIDYAISHFTQSLLQIQSWINRWLRWRPTSAQELDLAESRVLSYLKQPFRSYYVDIGNGWGLDNNKVWTIEMSQKSSASDGIQDDKEGLPLVLVHGFAAAIGLWSLNLDALANTNRKVYAFDLLGFGKSSRPRFDKSESVELELIESLERWRSRVGLSKFILLGHSFGGYLAMSYAFQYPDRVSHLILADPWGMPSYVESQKVRQNQYPVPMWVKMVASLMFQTFTPLAGLRAAGPWGPKLVHKMRPDLRKKFERITGEDGADSFLNYIYHCNAQSAPSGELAFKALSNSSGWARNPMIDRINELHPDVNLTFMYGAKSWIDRQPGFQAKQLLGERVDVHVIQGSGHHIYADRPEDFNDLVARICFNVDEKQESIDNNNEDIRADVLSD